MAKSKFYLRLPLLFIWFAEAKVATCLAERPFELEIRFAVIMPVVVVVVDVVLFGGSKSLVVCCPFRVLTSRFLADPETHKTRGENKLEKEKIEFY